MTLQSTSEGQQLSRAVQNGHWPAPVVQAARQEPPPTPGGVFSEAPAPAASSPQLVMSAAGAELALQRQAEGDTPPVSPDAPAAGPTSVPGTPGAPGTPAAGGVANPDEMVKKLFEPLLRRLKTELRLDRERRGMLTDLRH